MTGNNKRIHLIFKMKSFLVCILQPLYLKLLSPKGRYVGPIIFTCDLFGLVNLKSLSKIYTISQKNLSFKMFYPPKGDMQYLNRGPIVFTYDIFGFKIFRAFQKSIGFLIFFCFKMFDPPKGDTQYLTRGPFVFTYVLFGVSKSLEHFKNL